MVCGDDTVVPHKGLFVIRLFIPRKAHSIVPLVNGG